MRRVARKVNSRIGERVVDAVCDMKFRYPDRWPHLLGVYQSRQRFWPIAHDPPDRFAWWLFTDVVNHPNHEKQFSAFQQENMRMIGGQVGPQRYVSKVPLPGERCAGKCDVELVSGNAVSPARRQQPWTVNGFALAVRHRLQHSFDAIGQRPARHHLLAALDHAARGFERLDQQPFRGRLRQREHERIARMDCVEVQCVKSAFTAVELDASNGQAACQHF